MTMLGSLPPTTRGFDADATVGPAMARAFYAAGYRFAVRYVKRAVPHDYDLSVIELWTLLNAGLGVMAVQHYPGDGWSPTGTMGDGYGKVAAGEAHLVGMPRGTTLWLDLEGVAPGTMSANIIAFCNRWFDVVQASGYEPGCYVGHGNGLTAVQLYRDLKFARFWRALNLNDDEVPAVRGACMRQRIARSADRIAGCPFSIDVNIIGVDALGDTPTLVLP